MTEVSYVEVVSFPWDPILEVCYTLAVQANFDCRFVGTFTFIWLFTVKKLSHGCGKS